MKDAIGNVRLKNNKCFDLLTNFLLKFSADVLTNPCIPSPCGPNSECREVEDRAVCSCTIGMLGAPPNCRPECVIHQDCPSNRACLAQKCQDPCVGSCGFNARCNVQNHQPVCNCLENYEGDPYAGCNMRQGKCRHVFYPLSGDFLTISFHTQLKVCFAYFKYFYFYYYYVGLLMFMFHFACFIYCIYFFLSLFMYYSSATS